MMGYGLFGGLGMALGLIVWILVVAAIVWALFALFSGRSNRREETPLEILERRYARGEIDEAEFERARQRLGY